MVGKVHWLAPSGGGSATEERSTRNQIAARMVDEVLLALRRLARAMHRHKRIMATCVGTDHSTCSLLNARV